MNTFEFILIGNNNRIALFTFKIQQYIMDAEVNLKSDTLQENVSDTILRDFKNIWTKLQYVIIPRFQIHDNPEAVKELRNWDLWGPLIFCLLLSFVLNLGMETQDKGKSFGILFIIMWGGAFVVTINTKLLGGHISFFQCVCVLGYCVFPILLAAVAIYVIRGVGIHLLPIKIAISGVALLWSTFSSISFMNVLIEDEKKYIATFPIFLFYLFIDWFTLFI